MLIPSRTLRDDALKPMNLHPLLHFTGQHTSPPSPFGDLELIAKMWEICDQNGHILTREESAILWRDYEAPIQSALSLDTHVNAATTHANSLCVAYSLCSVSVVARGAISDLPTLKSLLLNGALYTFTEKKINNSPTLELDRYDHCVEAEAADTWTYDGSRKKDGLKKYTVVVTLEDEQLLSLPIHLMESDCRRIPSQCKGQTKNGRRCRNRRSTSPPLCHHHEAQKAKYEAFLRGDISERDVVEWWRKSKNSETGQDISELYSSQTGDICK